MGEFYFSSCVDIGTDVLVSLMCVPYVFSPKKTHCFIFKPLEYMRQGAPSLDLSSHPGGGRLSNASVVFDGRQDGMTPLDATAALYGSRIEERKISSGGSCSGVVLLQWWW